MAGPAGLLDSLADTGCHTSRITGMKDFMSFTSSARLRRIDGMPPEVSRELEHAFHRSFPFCIPISYRNATLWFRYGTAERGDFMWDQDLARYRFCRGVDL